jgi:diguanylate cyclase (GGDEF)-like protein/putative nucleotidyltransferase with HDIG domain
LTLVIRDLSFGADADPEDASVWKEFGDATTLEQTSPGTLSASTVGQHPTASSRLLLELLRLSRIGDSSASIDPQPELLDGVIARPVLRSLLAALRLRDAKTVQHARRTALLATGLARFLGWEKSSLRKLEVAALLHDIGKIGVPDHVLFKPGPLNPAEQELFVLQHAVGLDVLQACRVHQEVIDIISDANLNHANGLRSKTELSLGARILAIADAYDSLSHKQVYREGKTHEEILSVLGGSAGTRFDGNLINVMNRWIQAEGLPFNSDQEDSPKLNGAGFFQLAEEIQASTMCHIFSYLYALESMYDGFYLVDSDLRYRIWSTGMEQLLGRPFSQMLDRHWTSRQVELADTRGRPLPDAKCPLRQVIQSNQAQTAQIKVRHVEGQWLDVEVLTVPLFDHDGTLQGVAEIFRDLSSDRRRRKEDRELHQQATRDSLTGVLNRGELERRFEALLADFQKDGGPLSLIFLDVDYFKRINDTYLHLTGDQVLIGLAKLLESEMYSGEIIGRYGGEEFVILCPSTDLSMAVAKAERLRMAVSDSRLCDVNELKITASFGVTEVEPGDSMDDIFRRADKALFTSKDRGRNRTTSLTKREFLNGNAAKTVEQPEPSFEFNNHFLACITSDMIVLKLGSFVREQQARLIETSYGRVVIRLGTTFLLPFWGRKTHRQPVRMEITYGPPPKELEPNARRGASERSCFQVKILPTGWPPDAATFQARARHAFRLLKSYFVAD